MTLLTGSLMMALGFGMRLVSQSRTNKRAHRLFKKIGSRMIKKTSKMPQTAWLKKGRQVGPVPSGFKKLADQYTKLNSTPGLVDKVGNGRIEHDEMNNPKGIASKKAPDIKPAMGKMRKPKGC